MDHCVPQKLCDNPTPAMDPVTVCVVEKGTPKSVAAKITMAALVSGQHPFNVFNWVILFPIV